MGRVVMKNFGSFVYLRINSFLAWPFGKPENYRKIIKFSLSIESSILFWKFFSHIVTRKPLEE